jgi:hypothetical protein
MKVIAVEETPNPNARKFIVDTPTEQELSFFNADAARGYVLAEKLFVIDGVRSLLFLRDFITVNKSSEAKWADILKGVRKILSES